MTPKEKEEKLQDEKNGFLNYIESKGKAKDYSMASIDEMLLVLGTNKNISKDYYYLNKETLEIIKL